MRLPAALLCAFLAVSAALAPGPAAATRPAAGDPAPVAVGEVGGKPVNLMDYRGKVVVVTFWTASCTTCLAGLAPLDDLAAQLAPAGLRVLAVNLGDSNREYGKLLRKKPHSALLLTHDPGSSATEAWDVHMFPSLWIVDRNGRIAAHHEGYLPEDLPAIYAEIQRVVAASQPAGAN